MCNFITYLSLEIWHMHELHNCKDFVKFTDRGNGRTLKKHCTRVAPRGPACRHMNFRMGGLMFDSKFNSKQSFTQDLAEEILQTPILRKRILLADKPDDYVLYHIAIAKFGNCCSMLVFPFWRRQQRSYVLFCNVFSDVIFYPHILQQLRGLKTIPELPCLDF